MDLTLISYEVAKYALLYNILLFSIWLVMVRREGGMVSDVYLIVMGLFVARLYGVLMGTRARSLRVLNNSEYYDYMSGIWWDSRLLPEAIIFIALACLLTRRFIHSYFYNDPNYRAKNGRRKTDKKT